MTDYVFAPVEPTEKMSEQGTALAHSWLNCAGTVDVAEIYCVMLSEVDPVRPSKRAPYRLPILRKALKDELLKLEASIRRWRSSLKKDLTERNKVLRSPSAEPHCQHHNLEAIRAGEKHLTLLRAQANFLSRIRRLV